MEDDRVAILEAQLAQAKLIAEEADKKYEEVKSHNMRTLHSNIALNLLPILRFSIGAGVVINYIL